MSQASMKNRKVSQQLVGAIVGTICSLWWGIVHASLPPAHTQEERRNSTVQMASSMSDALNFDPDVKEHAKGDKVRVAAIYGEDNRVSVEQEGYPFTAIGKISLVGTAETCTASLISPCHVLTARHCVVKNGKARNNGKISFTTKDRKGTYDWEHLNYGDENTISDDWAVIKLQGKPGNRVGFFLLNHTEPRDLVGRGGFEMTGYSVDRTGGRHLLSDGSTEFIKPSRLKSPIPRGEGIVDYRGDSYLGASGGPIWEINHKGEAELVAFVSTSIGKTEESTGKKFNPNISSSDPEGGLAVTTSAFLSEAREFMRKYKCD